MGDNNHQAKRQRSLAPVAVAGGSVLLQKTWEMTALNDRKGVLAKFRVSPPSCCLISILTLKCNHLSCRGPKNGPIGQLGRPTVEVKRQGQEIGALDLMCIWVFSHHFQVQDILKWELYEVDLADHITFKMLTCS